jgi:glycosyltransferase involved in cell wall biosynthesis
MPIREFVFWQRIVSPHMAGLARELADRGATVTYVAERLVSEERSSMGWAAPLMKGVSLQMGASAQRAPDLVANCSQEAVHVVQGLRRNGYVEAAIRALGHRRARWGALLETVDDRGARGFLKRIEYSWTLRHPFARPDFVLAVGGRMPAWLSNRGFPARRVFPFTYFLDPHVTQRRAPTTPSFRIGFVGQLIPRKRVDLLINALPCDGREVEVVIIGSGPEEGTLRALASRRLGRDCVKWLGSMPMASTRERLAHFDCLVLPSEHDGWGAVVSEALLAGVPAICSDRCGAEVAVRASGVGGVFPSGNVEALRAVLERAIAGGPITAPGRDALARWARCLSNVAGAPYLEDVVGNVYGSAPRPAPPWTQEECLDDNGACAH